MTMKTISVFLVAVLLGCLLAVHRWGDSSHAIGFISLHGGMSRHPAIMGAGRSHYSQITTVTVLPPFEGAVRVALEGSPPMDYEIHLAKPVIDLGLRRMPRLAGDTLYNMKAGDRLALWTLIRPLCSGCASKEAAPPPGLAAEFPDILSVFKNLPRRLNGCGHKKALSASVHGRYTLAFYDAATDIPVLKVPLIFSAPEGENGRHRH